MDLAQNSTPFIHFYTRRFHVLEEVVLPPAEVITGKLVPRVFLKYTLEHVLLPRGKPQKEIVYETNLLPGEQQDIPTWKYNLRPSVFDAMGDANKELGQFINKQSVAGGYSGEVDSRQLQPLFPPRYSHGDLGLIYLGPSAVEAGVQRFLLGSNDYIALVSASRVAIQTGDNRSYSNPDPDTVINLVFYRQFQEYLSCVSCADLRIAGIVGKECYETRLDALDYLAPTITNGKNEWDAIRSVIIESVSISSPVFDYAGRSCPLIEDRDGGLCVRHSRYLCALGAAGDNDSYINFFRLVGYDPAGVILNVLPYMIPVPGCGVESEVIPISDAEGDNSPAEGAS